MSADRAQASVAAVDSGVPDQVVAMLDLLSATIVHALGFGVACINIARPDGTFETVSVAGDDDARRMLLGSVISAEIWDELLAVSEPWGLLRFADHRNEAANPDTLSWVPDVVPLEGEDAWHPEDALYAPLTASDGSRLGTLSVDLPRDGRRPNSSTCQALEAFAISAALAIENADLRVRAETSEHRYRWLASHDNLTGIGNRSILSERLHHALTRRAEDEPLLAAVVFIDLDRFKRINDDYSHQAGDHVLKTVANRIKGLVRPHDTVARWGGDEFVVLLEHVESETAATAVAQRITAAIAEPMWRSGRDVSVTASVGVAMWRAGDQIGVDRLITRADTAMYLVKSDGGNGCAAFVVLPVAPENTSTEVAALRCATHL